jgi:hypothetical protein
MYNSKGENLEPCPGHNQKLPIPCHHMGMLEYGYLEVQMKRVN